MRNRLVQKDMATPQAFDVPNQRRPEVGIEEFCRLLGVTTRSVLLCLIIGFYLLAAHGPAVVQPLTRLTYAFSKQ